MPAVIHLSSRNGAVQRDARDRDNPKLPGDTRRKLLRRRRQAERIPEQREALRISLSAYSTRKEIPACVVLLVRHELTARAILHIRLHRRQSNPTVRLLSLVALWQSHSMHD